MRGGVEEMHVGEISGVVDSRHVSTMSTPFGAYWTYTCSRRALHMCTFRKDDVQHCFIALKGLGETLSRLLCSYAYNRILSLACAFWTDAEVTIPLTSPS